MSDIEVQQMEENILRGVALAYERLVEQKKKEDIAELYQLISQSGKSMEEVRKMFSGEN